MNGRSMTHFQMPIPPSKQHRSEFEMRSGAYLAQTNLPINTTERDVSDGMVDGETERHKRELAEIDRKARHHSGFDCNNTDSPSGDPSPF